MSLDIADVLYVAPLIVIWFFYERRRRRKSHRNTVAKQTSIESGLHEPASLHPAIDPGKCMGCGACVHACPEGQILGLINGHAELLEPSSCIGHGACKAACPFDAITLVFGSATRGVDLPVVGPDFQTNIPGIYVAGELGGMGLIRNAIEQGKQAVGEIAGRTKGRASDFLDVVIVGAGPAGFSASLAAKQKGLSFKTFDQESLGGTVAHFPRGKIVMSRPAQLPIVGQVELDRSTKEDLLAFWSDVQNKTNLEINFNEPVNSIAAIDVGGPGFSVTTSRGTYRTRCILLCIGRRGSPRKLEVPGEDLSHVVYRLIDAEQYSNQKVVVVGGGDSAIEAAVSIAEQPGTTVTLSYRGEAFGRSTAHNRSRIAPLIEAGRIRVLFKSVVKSITSQAVEIEHAGQRDIVAAEAVVICAGGIVPSDFLKSFGIHIETKYGTI